MGADITFTKESSRNRFIRNSKHVFKLCTERDREVWCFSHFRHAVKMSVFGSLYLFIFCMGYFRRNYFETE